MFNRFTLGLMMNAVNGGSEYTKSLLLYLHKIYYKKEYRTLKKFSTMSLSELLALAESEEERNPYYANLSRVLWIAKMYGIKIDEECNAVYGILNEYSDKYGLGGGFSFDEATCRIVIVGGHSNWLSKMKKEFPNWIFVNPKASGTTDVSIVDKADYVYFFTDTISHSKYHQFMNVIRERKINCGYIHGVNIEKNIRDIYVDFEDD